MTTSALVTDFALQEAKMSAEILSLRVTLEDNGLNPPSDVGGPQLRLWRAQLKLFRAAYPMLVESEDPDIHEALEEVCRLGGGELT